MGPRRQPTRNRQCLKMHHHWSPPRETPEALQTHFEAQYRGRRHGSRRMCWQRPSTVRGACQSARLFLSGFHRCRQKCFRDRHIGRHWMCEEWVERHRKSLLVVGRSPTQHMVVRRCMCNRALARSRARGMVVMVVGVSGRRNVEGVGLKPHPCVLIVLSRTL